MKISETSQRFASETAQATSGRGERWMPRGKGPWSPRQIKEFNRRNPFDRDAVAKVLHLLQKSALN